MQNRIFSFVESIFLSEFTSAVSSASVFILFAVFSHQYGEKHFKTLILAVICIGAGSKGFCGIFNAAL